jgi:hypothetical protein
MLTLLQDDFPLASLPLLGYAVDMPATEDNIQKDFVFKLQFKNHVYFFRAESHFTYERSACPSSYIFFFYIFLGDFFFLFVHYSALLHLPPLRFHCADGCWDRTQDRCNLCIGSQTL